MTEDSLFGGPTTFEPVIRDRWLQILTRSWIQLMGRPPGSLADDLEELTPYFGTGARSKTIRDRVYSLPPADQEIFTLPLRLLLIVDGCALITPEGRIMLDVLLNLQRTGGREIGIEVRCHALEVANSVRSNWQAVWIWKQFDGTLSAPPLGAALFLLVNGSIGQKQALLLPSDDDLDRRLGIVILPLIAAFSRRLGGKEPEVAGGIRQHWAFTQVSKLLGRDVERLPAPGGTATYVRTGRQAALLENLAVRLEKGVDPPRQELAVREFVEEYRLMRGKLAALGQMHEDPTETHRILRRLADPRYDS